MNHRPITAHMVVKNEDNFIWYAITSVLPFVQRLLITDTGSTDETIPIIKSIGDNRISLQKRAIKNPSDIGKIRQEQIEATQTDWFWIVDGDEVYPKGLSEEIVSLVNNKNNLEGIVVGRYDLLGDIYHYQSESVGTYDLFGRKGHIVLRLINKKQIPRLHVSGVYPYEGYYDGENVEIINHDPNKFKFTQGKLWHAMYLPRSSNGANLADTFHRKKWKVERGIHLSADKIPEVFTQLRPDGIADVSRPPSLRYRLGATVLTPIKRLKRKLLNN